MNQAYTIYFASSNKDKLKEVKKIFSRFKTSKFFKLKSAPEGFFVHENGKTFLENAFKKASVLSKDFGVYAFSDDSGLEVEALNKQPGIKSARFFKNGKGMLEIVKKIRKKENKKCSFICAMVMTNPKGSVIFKTQKSWHGLIAESPKGKDGFGYDPIFYIPKLKKTSAELNPALKNKISHRAMAIKELCRWLSKNNRKFID